MAQVSGPTWKTWLAAGDGPDGSWLRWLSNGLGLIGLMLTALAAGVSTAGIYIGLSLMGGGLVPHLPVLWRALRETWGFWLVLVLAGYVLLRGVMVPAELAGDPWEATRDWLYVGGLPALVTAWWLGGDEGRIRWVLGLMVGGVVLGVMYRVAWTAVPMYLSGELRFGTKEASVNRLSFHLSGLVVALTALGPAVVGALWRRGRQAWSWVAGVGGALLGVAVLYVVILTQSRQNWGALALVLSLLGVAWLWRRRAMFFGSGRRAGWTLTGVGLLLVVVGVLLWSLGPIVEKRLAQPLEIGRAVATGQWDRAVEAAEELDRRTTIWAFGAGLVRERPIWGWGPGTPAAVSARGEADVLDGSNLHNLYLQVWATLGLPGLGLIAVLAGLAASAAWRAFRRGELSWSLGLCLAGELALFLMVNAVDIHYHSPRTSAFIILLTGIGVTHGLADRAAGLAEVTATTAGRERARVEAKAGQMADLTGPRSGA